MVKLESRDLGHEAQKLKILQDAESGGRLGMISRSGEELGSKKLDMLWLSQMAVAET